MTPARVFDNHRIWQLSDHDFLAAACLIGAAEAAHAPAAVVGIARGGVRLAEIVAEQLGIPAAVVRARHNTSEEIQQAATGRVLLDDDHNASVLGTLPAGAPLLVVDDICGTGATLQAVGEMLTAVMGPAGLRTAVLCRNAGSDHPLDCWGWDVSDWVHFPWEPEPVPGTGQVLEPLPPLTALRTLPRPPRSRS
ncbi:phosphoribosyltransferase domain-containing protein [Streptomyces sp. ET3-23]|uniref:phosphoribosyltransferase n=1 Tax=Streptomyces sp. ET3-23 TaxID=2885643 RepID=UPI001D0FE28B|nr:phosphoribosyltransferase family protein [Streptomyces sp. ET3-23]MCC2275459.1 phosphoribosyltransferase domain-containing protein [Streptomyces sp. ET3-23]